MTGTFKEGKKERMEERRKRHEIGMKKIHLEEYNEGRFIE